jgi:uncharacterized peroxidase-related enzyme
MIHNTIIKLTKTKLASIPLLETVESNLGFVPNLFSVIGESSISLKAFIEMNNQFSQSTLNATQREVVQTAVSVENQCNYCVAGHTKFAEVQGVDSEVIQAIRENQVIKDKKLQALNLFTRNLVRHKGFLTSQNIQQFIDAGFKAEQVIEVILGVCVKTFSNLTNNLLTIEIDEAFQKHQWQTDSDNDHLAII